MQLFLYYSYSGRNMTSLQEVHQVDLKALELAAAAIQKPCNAKYKAL